MTCRFYHRQAPTLACDAFPDGIPDDIIYSRVDHRQPGEGDRGIQCAQDPQMPELDEELYAWIFGQGPESP
jgi:hypothetical protein